MSTLETVRVLGHYFNSWRYERWSQWIALCELIDNSIDARARNVFVIFDKEKNKIEIRDDGVGSDDISRFFNLGDTKGHDPSQRLGRFGMGGVKAGCYLADWVHITTRHRGIERTGTVYWTKSCQQNTELQFEKGKERPTKDHHGTVVTLHGVRAGIERSTTIFGEAYQGVLRSELAMTYGPALRSGRLRLIVGDVQVDATEYPICADNPQLVYEGAYGDARYTVIGAIARQGALGRNWTNGIWLECAGRVLSHVTDRQKKRKGFQDGLDDFIGAPVWMLVRLHEDDQSSWPMTPDKTDITIRTDFLEDLCRLPEVRAFLESAYSEGEEIDVRIAAQDIADTLADVFGGEVLGGKERRAPPTTEAGAVEPSNTGKKRERATNVDEEAEGSITRSNKRSLLWKCVPAPLGADGPAVKVDAKTPKGVLRVMVTINTDIPYLAKAWRSEEFKRHLAAFIVPGGVFEDERAGAALYELMRPGTQLSFDNGVEHSTLMEIASIVLNRFDQANSLPRIAS